jgi:hypothetical protein
MHLAYQRSEASSVQRAALWNIHSKAVSYTVCTTAEGHVLRFVVLHSPLLQAWLQIDTAIQLSGYIIALFGIDVCQCQALNVVADSMCPYWKQRVMLAGVMFVQHESS